VAHPKGQRLEDVVTHSIQMLARYAPEIRESVVTRTGASHADPTNQDD
jgi:hypothetical protein